MQTPSEDDPAAQPTHPNGTWPHPGEPELVRLGVPATETNPSMQQDAVAELTNKLAWVIGSVYRMPYSNKKSLARRVAWEMMSDLITEHGYPSKIAKYQAR